MMHPLLYLMLLTGFCLAHYRGSYDNHNLIVREEPYSGDDRDIVECPVCEESENWLPNTEKCPIKRGDKIYKKCKLGTYINEVCGSRLDCYRGPGEQCTVKREFDNYGKKCAPGYYCHKSLGVCIGLGYQIDSNMQWQLNRFPYTWRRSDLKGQSDESKYLFEGGRNE
ncbi:unnamed protein product [Arctia plantaginis]|nr:unnamed protein product [Arctia plantaginis]CAB3248876.1 unnamed protein product [Arctia plantaginis]